MAWNRANKARRREITVWYDLRRAGVPEDQRDRVELLLRTASSCAICGSSYRLCVDHNHTTGQVRDRICDPCNRRVGALENQSIRAMRPTHPMYQITKEYLDRWNR